MANLILDIRIYESDELRKKTIEQWNRLRDMRVDPIAERFALKLREKSLETGNWDHLYIYLTKLLAPNDIKLRTKGDKVVSILVGIDENDLYEIDRERRTDFFLKTIRESFYYLSKEQHLDLEKVDTVEKLLKLHGEKLEIIQKEKTSRGIHTIVSYTVANQSRLYIFARDNKSERQGKQEIATLKNARDARTLVSRIVVKEGEIRIYPRKSNRAQWICNYYSQDLYSSDEFIRVSLDDLFSNSLSCDDNCW